MAVRTYCVIPHCAREDTNFFKGVFEDGLRVLYQGRLQSLLFSHVLSPAHDYVKHINGPLLATLREGGNATLLLATPNSEYVPPLSASATAAAQSPQSSPKCDGIAEITATAMGLYQQLFPLLFRNLEHCPAAQFSVLTVSASERVLLDNLQNDKRIRAVAEAEQMRVCRQTSATEWGKLLQLLEDRHVAMEESATSLEGQTACVVIMDLENYGRLVVVDTASSQELLQQLTLILGMNSEGEARTYPPRTPLRDALMQNVPPLATVQVVCFPAPQDTTRQTMRVLHFGSTVEAWRGKSPKKSHEFGRNITSFSALLDESSASKSVGRGGEPSGNAKHSSRHPTSHSVSFEVDGPCHRLGSVERFEVDNNCFKDSGSLSADRCNASGLLGRPDGVNSNRSDGVADESGLRRLVGHIEADSSSDSHQHDATPAQLPPPSVVITDRGFQRTCGEQWKRRVAVLEAQVAELAASNQCLQRARDTAVHEKEQVELELRSKLNIWADFQRAHNKAKRENADYAQLVRKLLQQVRVLEKDAGRQKRQDISVIKELRQVREEKKELEEQLKRLRKEVMIFRRDATYRAREATLSRIVPSEFTVPPHRAVKAPSTAISSSSLLASCEAQQQKQRRDTSVPSSTSSSTHAVGGGRGRGSATVPLSTVQHGVNSHRRASPRARRLYDTSTTEGDNEGEAITKNSENVSRDDHVRDCLKAVIGGTEERRVTDITIEELRWRNRHLEQEVARLQERFLRALTASEANAMVSVPTSTPPPPALRSGKTSLAAACPMCEVMRERVEYFQKELSGVREEKDCLLELLRSSKAGERRLLDDTADDEKKGDGAENDLAEKREAKQEQVDESEGSISLPQERSCSLISNMERRATHDVVAALLAGCASLQAQLECARTVLDRRLRRAKTSRAAVERTDPLSHISAQVLAEHHDAVAALAASLRHIAEKPATSPSPFVSAYHLNRSRSGDAEDSLRQRQQYDGREILPPVPRTATAGNVETLTHHLTFEAERCRHLRAFIPTFAQLAVATEHLLMRLEATAPEE